MNNHLIIKHACGVMNAKPKLVREERRVNGADDTGAKRLKLHLTLW